MAKCSRCGQAVATAPIICEKCWSRSMQAELESILQLVCDQYCVHLYEAADQMEMDEKCTNCDLAARIEALASDRQEVDVES